MDIPQFVSLHDDTWVVSSFDLLQIMLLRIFTHTTSVTKF